MNAVNDVKRLVNRKDMIMDILNLAVETDDDLKYAELAIAHERFRRKKEPAKTCYIVRMNDGDSGATYFKTFGDAMAELISELEDVELNNNKWSLESSSIPETEYNLRPDTWYS